MHNATKKIRFQLSWNFFFQSIMLYESCDEKIRNKRIRIALLEFKMFLKCGAVATYKNVNNVFYL